MAGDSVQAIGWKAVGRLTCRVFYPKDLKTELSLPLGSESGFTMSKVKLTRSLGWLLCTLKRSVQELASLSCNYPSPTAFRRGLIFKL